MRDAARELTHRFHLLQLLNLRLCRAALDRLLPQLVIDQLQLAQALEIAEESYKAKHDHQKDACEKNCPPAFVEARRLNGAGFKKSFLRAAHIGKDHTDAIYKSLAAVIVHNGEGGFGLICRA
ncbi:MAG: hypothetical protein WDN29_05550 [Methylovirgula sp.]